MQGIPVLFGEIAINEGYITSTTLTECLELQKLYRQPVLLGEILIEKGYLSKEHVDRIYRKQQIYQTKLDNEYFAHLVIKKKLLSSKQLLQLRKRYGKETAGDTPIPLHALAVGSEYLAMPVVEEIMKSSEYQYFRKAKLQGKTVIGCYELVGSIVKLKKTMIYRAIQVELDRLVAIKTLAKEFENAQCINAFFSEARATARFNHPNLVRIYDIGVENNTYFYAMEMVEGDNLSQKLSDEGRLQVGDALKIIRNIAKALAHIHNHQYIHGEVNPRNIVVREDGVIKLLDLSSSCCIKDQVKSSGKLTKMPQYMAPEQVQTGENLDVRTDIYSLGATFYRALTGHPPISGKTIEEIKKNIIEQEPNALRK